MKKIILILLVALFLSCGESKPEVVSPFKAGEIAYRKIDSIKVIILLDLGKWNDEIYWYRIQYKIDSSKVEESFAYSSELFKK